MRHIFTVQDKDGSFREVGMTNRWVRIGISRIAAVRIARQHFRVWGKPIRVETWVDSEFYKPGSRPINVSVVR